MLDLVVLKDKGLTSDKTIEFTGIQTAKNCPIQLRRIGYRTHSENINEATCSLRLHLWHLREFSCGTPLADSH